ncbi:MAG: hypothetical protein H6Q59_1102 [Firmicutes bacterium]|nr:hypothetical protein [Bacillota bacterium]
MNFEELYQMAIRTSHNLVEDVRFSRELHMVQALSCADNICRYMEHYTNIFTSLNLVQNKYPYLYSHPVNVAFLSYEIGKWIRLTPTELYDLVCSAFLHDIGKAKIRDSLLNKKEKLNGKEVEIMRTHSIIGYRLLEHMEELNPQILLGILHHHERIDGSGYPLGLKGDRISLYGRIIAVADIFDAVTATKSYQTKSSPFKAVEEIADSSFHILDPYIGQMFVNKSINFFYKCEVKLSNEQVGEIIYINQEEKTKPIIRCENEYHNLSKERNLEIVDVL